MGENECVEQESQGEAAIGQEETLEDGCEVAVPHEVNENANLRRGKNLIVVSF